MWTMWNWLGNWDSDGVIQIPSTGLITTLFVQGGDKRRSECGCNTNTVHSLTTLQVKWLTGVSCSGLIVGVCVFSVCFLFFCFVFIMLVSACLFSVPAVSWYLDFSNSSSTFSLPSDYLSSVFRLSDSPSVRVSVRVIVCLMLARITVTNNNDDIATCIDV